MINPKPLIAIVVSCVFLMAGCNKNKGQINISSEIESPEIQFAIEEIQAALAERETRDGQADLKNVIIIFSLHPDDNEIRSEGFRIIMDGRKVRIIASDEAGAMYGGLEVAEEIKIAGLNGITEQLQNPYMELRGTKFNIPLDVRTPSYTDVSDVAQKNIPEMWSFDFWKEYIDNLARYRYNYISLWNLHPFPSMVRVPGYENVALDDVLRSTVDWEEFYNTNGTGFCTPEILADPDTLIKITMDEKIEFWRKVMKYAKNRNIDFYIITWNIFVHGAKGKYGITDDIDNPVTRDYFRKSVKQMFIAYPDLAGIGLTTGENMPGSSAEEKEKWAFDTYARGVLDAANEMPDRRFTLIHRQHQSGAQQIAEKFKPLIEHKNIEFIFSFKYAKAHVMSATSQPFHENYVNEIGDLKTIWTLRNDDDYYFRWGAPDFVRTFLKNIPVEVTRGFYYGSDQWVWGREFTMKEADEPRQIEIVKHWYHWMMWGRLGYNPEMTNERFIQILQSRFPDTDGEKLFNAWQEASMIYPVTTGFHWGPLDFQWYIESCRGRTVYTDRYTKNETGFHDVNVFINLPPHPKSGFQSIPEFVKMTIEGDSTQLKTPLEVAEILHTHSDKAIEILGQLDAGDNRELKVTLHDIRTMATLGKYYACKISGSTQLALYRETKNKKFQVSAIEELENALEAWKQYTLYAMQQNINPIWTNRVGYVDWVKATEWVANDIIIARSD